MERIAGRLRRRDRHAARPDRPIEADVDLRLPERGFSSWIGRGRGAVAGVMLLLFLVAQMARTGPDASPETDRPIPDSAVKQGLDAPFQSMGTDALRRTTAVDGTVADETPRERLERVGNLLAQSLPTEQRVQAIFRLKGGDRARTGVDSDGSIFATEKLLETIRNDHQLAAMLSIELAYSQALRSSPLAAASAIRMDQITEIAIQHMQDAKYNPSVLVPMAEWILKQSSLSTFSPLPSVGEFQNLATNILRTRGATIRRGGVR